jgi:hypothetical protein
MGLKPIAIKKATTKPLKCLFFAIIDTILSLNK